MHLSVKSARCAACSVVFLGVLFLGGSLTYFGLRIARLFDANNRKYGSSNNWNVFGSDYMRMYWYWLYPVFIAILCKITGVVGLSATKKTRTKNICLINTFLLLSLFLAGCTNYMVYDFQTHIQDTRRLLGSKSKPCRVLNKNVWTNCYVSLLLEGSLVFVALLIALLSCWSAFCCLVTFCRNEIPREVEPREDDQHQEPQNDAQHSTMPRGAVMVPMMPCNALPNMTDSNKHASTEKPIEDEEPEKRIVCLDSSRPY